MLDGLSDRAVRGAAVACVALWGAHVAWAGEPTEQAPVCAAEQSAVDGGATSQTLAALGYCLEKAGKLTRADAAFHRLLEVAQTAGDKEGEGTAHEHLAALDARTPKLRVEVVGASPDIVVELDGAKVDPSAFGVARPIDPGDHAIRVLRGTTVLKADTVLVIEMSKQTYTVDVAALSGQRPGPTAAGSSAPPAPQASASNAGLVGPPPSQGLDLRRPDEQKSSGTEWLAPTGTALIAIGTVGVLTFAGLEIGALAMKGTADCTDLPNDATACTKSGFDSLGTARTVAEAGQWVGVAGAVVLATGIGFAIGGAASSPKSAAMLVMPRQNGAMFVVGGAL